MRKIILFAFFALVASGQKKPVTLEALNEWRGNAVRDVPGDPVWAPDGKTFVFRQGKKLKLYEVAAKRAIDVVDLDPMDAAAIHPPTAERYEWENRRVDAAALQWDPAGRELLYYADGDLFLVDVHAAKWRQLTKTPVAERDPKFSPDGKRISFRRNWDLYVLDIATSAETRLTTGGSDTLRNGGLDWVYPE